MKSNRGGQTFGETTACFLCDFWWLILIIIMLGLGSVLAYNRFLRPEGEQSQPGPTQVMGTGDVQVTLKWNDLNDLDLWVTDPAGEKIFYQNRTSESGGTLDLDANRDCTTNVTPNGVENIFWPTGSGPSGTYQIYVNLYKKCEYQPSQSEFEVNVLVDGNLKTYSGTVSVNNPTVSVVEIQK